MTKKGISFLFVFQGPYSQTVIAKFLATQISCVSIIYYNESIQKVFNASWRQTVTVMSVKT